MPPRFHGSEPILRFAVITFSAGVVSAILLTLGRAGGAVGLLHLIAPLPLMLVAATVNLQATVFAGVVGFAAFTRMTSLSSGFDYAVFLALPALVLAELLGRNRRVAEPPFIAPLPAGTILLALLGTVAATLVALVAAVALGGQTEARGPYGMIARAMMREDGGFFERQVPALLAYREGILSPANALLALMIARGLGRARQPRLDLYATALPAWTLALLPAALGVGLFAPGAFGHGGRIVAVTLALGHVLAGIAVVMARSRAAGPKVREWLHGLGAVLALVAAMFVPPLALGFIVAGAVRSLLHARHARNGHKPT